jgi:hypothetical protein
VIRRAGLALLIVIASCVHLPQRSPAGAAAEYLWSQQSDDGGWHSRTYGLLRSGQSLTPFVLDALLQVPEDVYRPSRGKIDRALVFIERHLQSDGSLGMADPGVPDYPNYATALAVSAFCRAKHLGWQTQVQRMTEYLRRQQFTEQNGWRREDPAYGAWGMGGERRTPPHTGHVDLSMTRHVIEALRDAGVPASDAVFERAAVFVERCQNVDGGFFFATTEPDTNKAGHDGKRFRSYGTATADGILALVAIGRAPSDERVLAARAWLISNHRSMAAPGFSGDAYQRWPRGLAFYYAAASSQAFRALHISSATVTEALERTQRADGSWVNQENLVKEDDPLIATAFSLRALNRRTVRSNEFTGRSSASDP